MHAYIHTRIHVRRYSNLFYRAGCCICERQPPLRGGGCCILATPPCSNLHPGVAARSKIQQRPLAYIPRSLNKRGAPETKPQERACRGCLFLCLSYRRRLQPCRNSVEECSTANLNLCELEAIRPAAHKCGADSGCPTMAFVPELEGYNYREKMPGFSQITASDWKANTAGSYEETEWSMSHGNCDQCVNTAVMPSCALPAKCNKGVPVCCAAPRTFAQAVREDFIPRCAAVSFVSFDAGLLDETRNVYGCCTDLRVPCPRCPGAREGGYFQRVYSRVTRAWCLAPSLAHRHRVRGRDLRSAL